MQPLVRYVVRYAIIEYDDDDESSYRHVQREREFRSLRAAGEFARRMDKSENLFRSVRRVEVFPLSPEEDMAFTRARRVSSGPIEFSLPDL